MAAHANPYEVRCPHCDVSFPVGTRKCIHCGEKTVRGDRLESVQAMIPSGYEPVGPSSKGSNVRSMSMPSPGPAEHDTDSFFQLPEFSSEEREIEESDEEPTSVGRAIIRGLGGFIWVIVLIGFTLARNCGGD